MDIEKLKSLAQADFSHLQPYENNVKYHIVMPFLKSFGLKGFLFENAAQGSRIDINIGDRIIVETKSLNQKLDLHVDQLKEYSVKESAVLAILTNGRSFRIYSPKWRKSKIFAETIIYEFELTDLKDDELLSRLEKILA